MSGTVASFMRPKDRAWRSSDIREITARLRPREPVHLFCASALKARASKFQQHFPGTVSYAVKANPEQRVIDTLVEQGIQHFDVASIGEVEAVARRYPGATLHFNNPVKDVEAIADSYHLWGVRSFALDDVAELENINRVTNGDPEVMYSVRFKLPHEGASYDFGSKFGATPEQAADLLRRVSALGARPSLTFHPGSQCTDPRMYARYLEAAAKIVAWAGVEIAQVNVGGGFPERYCDGLCPLLERYFRLIRRCAALYFHRPPALMCEPGRAMVAPSISLLTRVIHVRDDSRTVFLNDGVYGAMQEQSVVDISLPTRVWRDGQRVGGDTLPCRVFGPTCDPVDRLSNALELPLRLRVDDYIEFGLLGAYGSATATDFNGFSPAVYMNVSRGFLDS